MTDLTYSGRTSCYGHKHSDWEEKPMPTTTESAISSVTLIEAQWSSMPVEVEEEVRYLWNCYGLGNDSHYLSTTLEELRSDAEEGVQYKSFEKSGKFVGNYESSHYVTRTSNLPYLLDYLVKQNISEKQPLLIHWWW